MAHTRKERAASDRGLRAQELFRQQERRERRRTIIIVAACAPGGLVIIGAGAYPLIKQSRTQSAFDGKALAHIGAKQSEADCSTVTKTPASGGSDHRPDGSRIDYETTPPAFGPHYAVPAPLSRKFYTEEDRPAVPTLVHNLENGYTILWYDDTIANDDQRLAQVRAIANLFEQDSGPTGKFIVAPWTKDDGPALPDGKHVAMTHWSVGGGGADSQVGVSQYCARQSGEAVPAFVKDYPYSDSPEPSAG